MDDSDSNQDRQDEARDAARAWAPPKPEHLQALLPQYQFEGLLGVGGMGAVYRAVQVTLDRAVAIKVLPPGIQGTEVDYAVRFQNEARMMAKLSHPGIVHVNDFGQTAEGHLYLVMELVEGSTLHDQIRANGRLPRMQVISYAIQLCEALECAHGHGVLHRDIKPVNILIDSGGRLKIADFGLARPVAAFEHEVRMGTPDYVAPEVMRGAARVDERADVYSVGVVLHEMLTGSVPVEPGRPVPSLVAEDPGWSAIVERATQAEPVNRYANVAKLTTALLALKGTSRRRVVTVREQKQKPPTVPTWAIPVSLACLTLGLGLWWWSHHEVSADRAPDAIARADRESSQGDATGKAGKQQEAPAQMPGIAAAPTAPPEPPPAPPDSGNAIMPVVSQPFQLPEGPPGHVFRMNEAHHGPVNALVLFPDGSHLATGSADGTVKIWDLAKGTVLGTLGPVGGEVRCVAVSPDGRFVCAGNSDYTVRLWETTTGELKGASPQRGQDVTAVAFSQSGRRILAASHIEGASLQLWNWQDTVEGETLGAWLHPVRAIAMLPGSEDSGETRFLTAGGRASRSAGPDMEPVGIPAAGTEIWLADFKTRSPQRMLPPLSFIPARMAVSADGMTVALTQNLAVFCLSLETGRILSRIPMDRPADSVILLEGGRLLLTGHQDKTWRIWESSTGRELHRVTAGTACTAKCAVNADETWAATAGGTLPGPNTPGDGDYAPHLWRLPKLSELRTAQGRIADARFQMERLDQTDTALAALRESMAAEWAQISSRVNLAAAEEIEKKYVAALQRGLVGLLPAQRDAFLEEISRVTNKQPDPGPKAGWPAQLKHLHGILQEQLAALRDKPRKDREELARTQQSRVSAIAAMREKSGDSDGALRARALLEEIDGNLRSQPAAGKAPQPGNSLPMPIPPSS